MRLCAPLVLIFVSFGILAEDDRFVPPWKVASAPGNVRPTDNPFVFRVARSAGFKTIAEADAFARNRDGAKVIDQKTNWRVIYFDELDVSSLFAENEREAWKTGVRNYALWVTFLAKHDFSAYVRDGKLYCIGISEWKSDETVEAIARLKRNGPIVKTELIMRAGQEYIRNTHEIEIPLKFDAELKFNTYARAQEHLLLQPIADCPVREPSMRLSIESEAFRLPGFVVQTHYLSENRSQSLSVECTQLDDRSQAHQLLVRLFFVPQNFAIRPEVREIDGHFVLASSYATGWITGDNLVYMTWGDPKNEVRREYLKKFPSALQKDLNFKGWMQNEANVARSLMKTAIDVGDLNLYFFAYLHLSRIVVTNPKIPVLSPPYYEGVTLEVARWHYKQIEYWLQRIDERKEALQFREVPVCYRDSLAPTVRWMDVGPDWLGAAAAQIDLQTFRKKKIDEDLALRREVPSDADMAKTANVAMEDYLKKRMEDGAKYHRNFKREEDCWTYEWESALGMWFAIRITGPELTIRRDDPVSASAIFTSTGKGVATQKYYLRFDTLKKVWGEVRLTP